MPAAPAIFLPLQAPRKALAMSKTVAIQSKTTKPKMPRSGLYGSLFAPTEDMLLVHEQGKPAAILRRAGLSPGLFNEWQRKIFGQYPGLRTWLFSFPNPIPAEIKGAISPTPAMFSFRLQATLRAIASASRRSAEQIVNAWKPRGYCREDVSVALIDYWLRKFSGLAWFEGWLLRALCLKSKRSSPPIRFNLRVRR